MHKTAAVLLSLALGLSACSTSPAPGSASQANGAPQAKADQRPVTMILPDGTTQQVTGFVKDGYVMVEDDIIVAEAGQLTQQGTYVVDTRYRWSGRTVPYTFASNVPQAIRDRVAQAASTIRATTNTVVTPRTSSAQRDYVQITYNTGTSCASGLGKTGGRQTITLADRCSTGSIIHEFGHTLGLFHEQTRPDRDQYVEIVWANIPADWQSQYQIRSGSAGYGTYDFDSIMHYPAYFDGKLAIRPLNSSVNLSRMGQRNGYSSTDVSTLNAMYPR
ncbi:M12 family metallopeptidase [Deinococcus marmoris]|uniref:M12 family metallopeptidase n=1 Tax=Deinococcus marmoris TaxID=249408 RepID=UPI0004953BA0|nr:M12 family metallopeptidase [Deinococcus marmoris]